MGGAIVASTFAASPASPVRAVFLRLVPAVLASGCPRRKRRRTKITAAASEIDIHVLQVVVLLPELHAAAAAAVYAARLAEKRRSGCVEGNDADADGGVGDIE